MKQSRRVVVPPVIATSSVPVPVQEVKNEDVVKTKLGLETSTLSSSTTVSKKPSSSSTRRKKETPSTIDVAVIPSKTVPTPVPVVESILEAEEEEHLFDNAELLEEETIEEDENNTTTVRKRNRRIVSKESYYQDFEAYMTNFQSFIESIPQGQVKVNTLLKKLKQLQHDSYRLLKLRRDDRKPRGENNSGFMKPIKVSSDLASFMGLNPEEPITRVLVTKKLCQYIKEKDLQNPEDRRQILPDENLKRLFQMTGNQDEDKLTYYSMQKAIQQHIFKI